MRLRNKEVLVPENSLPRQNCETIGHARPLREKTQNIKVEILSETEEEVGKLHKAKTK